MSQIRFQFGIPKAGSAARLAEGERRAKGLGSLAGSAARAAEEAKRNAPESGFRGATSLSMRAAGGQVFTPSSKVSPAPVAAEVAAAATERQVSQVSTAAPVEVSNRPGLLPTVASRFQSLVRSLLGGERASPNITDR